MKNEQMEDVVYGLNPAFETVLAGKRRVFQAFLGERSASGSRFVKLTELLRGNQIETKHVDKQVLFNLCGSREHQGVVLKTGCYPFKPFDAMSEDHRMVLIDNVEDPRNLGAILRSCEIFGWRSVLLPSKGSAKIYPSVVKASAGATEYLDIATDRSANYYVRVLKERGFVVVALDAAGTESLERVVELDFDKLLLVTGGEDKSVGQFILNLADYVVRIEQKGRISSLNASVAAGIALHAL